MWEGNLSELRGNLWPSWEPVWVEPPSFQDDEEEADLQRRAARRVMKSAMTKQKVCGCVPAAGRNVWFSSEAKKNITISKTQL